MLRSKNIYGPYEWKTVLAQGETKINGPHQGAWVDTTTGEDWFLHFQDVGAHGRLLHLQPMKWVDDWPVIGIDKDEDGCGEPVLFYKKPDVGKKYSVCTPQESDEFNSQNLSPQWQWNANINEKWMFCNGQMDIYVFILILLQIVIGIYGMSQICCYKRFLLLILQQTTKLTFKPTKKYTGERTGLVVMGLDYAGLFVENTKMAGTVSVCV